MITTITSDIFNAIIPTTIDPTGQVFDYCQLAMEEAEEELIQNYFSEEVITNCANNIIALNYLKRFIVLSGFVNTIPMLDLILTPNGFAVTSSEQLAPASRDRVDALKKICYHLSFSALNNLINQVLTNPSLFELWTKQRDTKEVIKHFFWKMKDICFIFAINEKDYEEDSSTADLYRIDALIAPYMSRELIEHLWSAVATHKETKEEKTLLLILRKAYAAIERKTPVHLAMNDAMAYINANIEVFPSFKESEIYKSSIEGHYKNQKDDKIFFFA